MKEIKAPTIYWYEINPKNLGAKMIVPFLAPFMHGIAYMMTDNLPEAQNFCCCVTDRMPSLSGFLSTAGRILQH